MSGGSATIAFDRDSIGATLTLDGATIALQPGLDTLPP
jgi:hypothetical protein